MKLKILHNYKENLMENLLQNASTKLKRWIALLQTQRKAQYGVLGGYLLLWLLSSGSLTTTLWVGLGVGLGWLLGRSGKQE